MLYWINFLHLHQPPTQAPEVVKKVTKESYLHILNLLEKFPNLKLTLNITGSLLEKLKENNLSEIIEGYKKFLKTGRIELTATAMHHPILPLIPEKEVEHQINLFIKKGEEVFGKDFRSDGFFLPEMAYNKKVGKVIKKMGFKWIILDQSHFSKKEINNEVKYKDKESGLIVIFRNRKLSKGFPPEAIVRNLESIKKEEKFIITAHDGEMYGHWHTEERGFYQKAFLNKEIKNITVSEYLKKLSKTEEIKISEASWETTKEEKNKGILFALWNDPKNKIHQKLWDFEKLVYKTISENKSDSNYKWAKYHYDRGISSCFWWWASGRKLDAFSPISWNPEKIEKGLGELIKSVRSLEKISSQKKIKAEKVYTELLLEIWTTHWKKHQK